MAMIEVGRLCVKIAGRDAGREGLIVEVIDKNFVMIDGNVRRRKCNISHVTLLPKKAEVKEKANHDEVMKALASLGIKEKKFGKYVKKPKKEKTSEVKKEKTKLLKRRPKAEKKPKKEKAKKEKKAKTKK